MNLDEAISKHVEWKLKFRRAIAEHETMDAETISKDNRCELGKWLHGDAKARFGQLKSYATCLAAHAAFHVEAGRIAETINQKKFKEAEAMIQSGSAYATTSGAVGSAIVALKRESGL